jgi:hypothetical protein
MLIIRAKRPAWHAAAMLLVLFALLGFVGPAWVMAALTAVADRCGLVME